MVERTAGIGKNRHGKREKEGLDIFDRFETIEYIL